MSVQPHNTQPRASRNSSGWILAAVFTAVVGSFLTTIVVARQAASEVDDLASDIVSNSAPSIEHLATVRGTVAEVVLGLSRYIDTGPGARTPTALRLQDSMARLTDSVTSYLSLSLFPGELNPHDAVQGAWGRFDELAQRTRELVDRGEHVRARALFEERLIPAANTLVTTTMEAIAFNAHQGQQAARQITRTRERATLWAGVATAVCVVLGLAGALQIRRQDRKQRILADEHARTLEQRASELEQFAGRVAHDIRNPLSTATLGTSLIPSKTSDEEVLAIADRINRSLGRADAIIADLLQFARAGAQPDPGARVSPGEIINELADALVAEAENDGIELRWEPVPPVRVACAEGVFLSILGNLIRNAVKYMGDAKTRRITVTVRDLDAMVRTEVADTGPGIRPEAMSSLFDPYFRDHSHRGADGLGLGLATVRKLVESHGGTAGVTSAPGQGSTFWFELPSAGASKPRPRS